MVPTFMSIYEFHKALCYTQGKGVLELCIESPNEGVSFADFCDYYERHYRPLLEQLAKEKPDTAARSIVQDMDAIFLKYKQEFEND